MAIHICHLHLERLHITQNIILATATSENPRFDTNVLTQHCKTVTSHTIITVTIDTLLKISSPLELAALTLGAKQIASGFWNRSLLLLQLFRLNVVWE